MIRGLSDGRKLHTIEVRKSKEWMSDEGLGDRTWGLRLRHGGSQ